MIRLAKALFHFIYTYIACWCIETWELAKCYYRINKALRDRFKREMPKRGEKC